MVLHTEDTGKIFEMAICLAYGIPYDGNCKYGMELPERLTPRLVELTQLFPMCRHTANKQARYDFTSLTGETHLSAKSTKKGGGKVAPQVIGQSQPDKFCQQIGIEFIDVPLLKRHIQTNITEILPILVNYTFDCPTIFYNQSADTIRYITLNDPIDWKSYEFEWSRNWDVWHNSATLKIKNGDTFVSLVEFQFHTKSRTNMAIRWVYDNFLTIFQDKLTVRLLTEAE